MVQPIMGEGSIKTLWRISSSLMVSFFSLVAMMFVDRLFLAYYSAEALSAATSAGTLYWSAYWFWVMLASMTEVFVAQYNGAKEYRMLGTPVWQMIWLSLISFLFFFCLGVFGGNALMNFNLMNSLEVKYFKWCCYFGPIQPLLIGISAFYIGQGKTRLIQWLAMIGNCVNLVLDPLLIFKFNLGISGAAIATGIGMSVQLVIISYLFLKRQNQKNYGTNQWRFHRPLFYKIIRYGFPSALFVALEFFGWALFYWMMEKTSPVHILVASIAQSIVLLFFFFGLALEKGAATVAGNLIGERNFKEVFKVFRSGMILIGAFAIVASFFFAIYPDLLLKWFFRNPEAYSGLISLIELEKLIKAGLILVGIYMIFENVRWLLGGILTAAGDTLYLLITGTFSVIFFLILPTYFFVMKPIAPVTIGFYIWVFYSVVCLAFNLTRFLIGKWQERSLIGQSNSVDTTPT